MIVVDHREELREQKRHYQSNIYHPGQGHVNNILILDMYALHLVCLLDFEGSCSIVVQLKHINHRM